MISLKHSLTKYTNNVHFLQSNSLKVFFLQYKKNTVLKNCQDFTFFGCFVVFSTTYPFLRWSWREFHPPLFFFVGLLWNFIVEVK